MSARNSRAEPPEWAPMPSMRALRQRRRPRALWTVERLVRLVQHRSCSICRSMGEPPEDGVRIAAEFVHVMGELRPVSTRRSPSSAALSHPGAAREPTWIGGAERSQPGRRASRWSAASRVTSRPSAAHSSAMTACALLSAELSEGGQAGAADPEGVDAREDALDRRCDHVARHADTPSSTFSAVAGRRPARASRTLRAAQARRAPAPRRWCRRDAGVKMTRPQRPSGPAGAPCE